MAIHALILYRQRDKYGLFILSMLLFSLAGLLKISSLIAFIFLLFVFVLERFPISTLKAEKLFRHPIREFVGFVLVLLTNIAWYTYAHLYNADSGFKYTFNSIYPIWEESAEELERFQELITLYVFPTVFHWSVLGLLLLVALLNLILFRHKPLLSYLCNIVILLGGVLYFLLWAPLLSHHDYYYVALLILFPAILVPFYQFLHQRYPWVLQKRSIRIIALLFLTFNFVYCMSVVHLKSDVRSPYRPLITNEYFVEIMEYFNWERRENFGRLERMESYLNDLGVTHDAKVVVLPDPSFNISLYLLNRRGWTGREDFDSIEDMERLMQRGPTHLIILEDKMLEAAYLQPYLDNPIGNFEGVLIYKL